MFAVAICFLDIFMCTSNGASQGRKFRKKIDLKPIGSGRAKLMEITFCIFTFDWNLYVFCFIKTSLCFFFHFFTFLLESLLSLHFSIDMSTFFLLFYWNFHFLLYFSIEISSFFLGFIEIFTFRLKYLLSLNFDWNLLHLRTKSFVECLRMHYESNVVKRREVVTFLQPAMIPCPLNCAKTMTSDRVLLRQYNWRSGTPLDNFCSRFTRRQVEHSPTVVCLASTKDFGMYLNQVNIS